MKNKIIKIFILIVFFISILPNNCIVYASKEYAESYQEGLKNPIANPDAWKPLGLGNEKGLKQKTSVIIGTVNIIGVIVSVIALIIIGIKYMIGSTEEKASYKQELMPYLIGAVFVFSSTTIANVIYNLAINF